MPQHEPPARTEKEVPARNNLKKSPLYANSRANEITNRDPNFVYEWKTTDPDHPSALSNTGQLSDHEYGNSVGGFVAMPGWQVVQRAANDKAAQLAPRSDDGKPIDTVVRHGKQVLCRMPRDEYEKYSVADDAYQEAMERAIYSPERGGDGTVRMTAIVSRDTEADRVKMLRDAGHTIPGYDK